MTLAYAALLIALLVCFALTIFLGWLLYVAIGRHGQVLLSQDELRNRLASLEMAVADLARVPEKLPVMAAPVPEPAPAQSGEPGSLPLGSPAPSFSLADLKGRQRRLSEFLGKPLVVAFFSPTCGFCTQLAPRLRQLPEGGPEFVLFSRGDRAAHKQMSRQHGGLAAGTRAPAFTLPALAGGERSLSDFRGRKLLLVFSDPKCGPCDALAPTLEALHQRHSGNGLEVIMVSRGEKEENAVKAGQLGLSLPILLQNNWEISQRYAMFATPVGYLIDEAGVIARDVAIGSDAIMQLLQ
jgi:peroxiredoxin